MALLVNWSLCRRICTGFGWQGGVGFSCNLRACGRQASWCLGLCGMCWSAFCYCSLSHLGKNCLQFHILPFLISDLLRSCGAGSWGACTVCFSWGRSSHLFGFGGVGGCDRLAGWEGLSLSRRGWITSRSSGGYASPVSDSHCIVCWRVLDRLKIFLRKSQDLHLDAVPTTYAKRSLRKKRGSHTSSQVRNSSTLLDTRSEVR